MSDYDTSNVSGTAAISAPLSYHILRILIHSFYTKTTKWKSTVAAVVVLLIDRKRFTQIMAIISKLLLPTLHFFWFWADRLYLDGFHNRHINRNLNNVEVLCHK